MTTAVRTTTRSDEAGRWAVSAMFFINGFLMGSWAPQIPFMLPRHDISQFTLGLLILLFGLGAIMAMAPAGFLINHYGTRKVVMVSASVACLSLPLVIFAPSVPLVALALWMMGASSGMMDTSMNANAVEVERRLGRALMSASHGFWSLGGFVGGGLGGVAIARFGVEWHAALAGAALLALTWAFAPRLVTEAHHQSTEVEKPKFVWALSPAILIIGLMALFSMAPEGAVLDWSALYLSKQLQADVATSGLAFGAFAGTMALMRFLGDSVRNRFGAISTLRASGAVAAIGILAASLAPTPWFAIVAFGIAGIGFANLIPIEFSAAGNQAGVSPGAGIATVTFMAYSGMLAAPSSIGYVADRIGFRQTYVVLALMLAAVALLASRVKAADRRNLA